MRRILFLVTVLLSLFAFEAKTQMRGIVDSLTTIDPEIRKYFPRWKVCETDLQIQIYQAFKVSGYDEKKLSRSKIEVLSAPRVEPYVAFDILLLTCGQISMNANDISQNIGKKLIDILAGEDFYSSKIPPQTELRTRDYCFVEIPAEIPITNNEAEAILDFLKPSNAKHAFTLSLFEQTFKIGDSGFWLSNKIGNDEIGAPFWFSGLAKGVLQRPLYANADQNTNNRIPYLINAYLGGGYRVTSGINPSGMLNWVSARHLNEGDGGKLIAGLDFNMPFHPQFGFHFNVEVPFNVLKKEPIDETKWAVTPNSPADPLNYSDFSPSDPEGRYGKFTIKSKVPILRATGQFSAFYYLWMDESKSDFENFFRFDLGLNYYEIREFGLYRDTDVGISYIEIDNIDNLKTSKPNSFGDWIYARVEYRNQATWPFGASIQYANQTLLGRVYVPLVNWLYIEGKIAIPCRGLFPWESKTIFMISPVLRLTI